MQVWISDRPFGTRFHVEQSLLARPGALAESAALKPQGMK